MTLTKEDIVKVFKAWTNDFVAAPDEYESIVNLLESPDEWAERNAEYFIALADSLHVWDID